MWAYYAILVWSVHPSVPFTLSLQLLDETWYKERSHCVDMNIIMGALSNYFFNELHPLDLAFSFKNTLSSQFLLNLWEF
jgi:hypothetical protein